MSDSILCRFETNQISEAVYHAPTNKFWVLPVELLRMILRLVYPPPLPGCSGIDPSDSDPPYPKSIITLSSVCQLWRDVVIKDPTFWSFISLPSSPSSVEMLISRSNQAPLVVHILFTENAPSKSMCTMIFDEYHRFQRLSIVIDDELEYYPQEWGLIISFMSRPAPMLESLQITEAPPQLDGLLKGGAPQLRELCIRGDGVPLLSFTSLRVLDITTRWDDHGKSYENLLVLLLANPQLESLSYNDTDWPDYPSYPHPRLVDLPNLENLVIRTTHFDYPGVLEGLVFPSDTHTLFEVYECNLDNPCMPHLPLLELEIQFDNDTCAISALQCFVEASVFSLDTRHDSRPIFVLKDTILSKYDLSKITFLSIKFYDESELYFTEKEDESIMKIFQSLSSLRTLEVAHWDWDGELAEEPAMSYLEGLMNPIGLDVPSLPCPLLVEMKIMHPTASLSYANQLKQCIRVRSDANCPFSGGVKLFDCTKLSSEVRTFLDGLVEWKEHELEPRNENGPCLSFNMQPHS